MIRTCTSARAVYDRVSQCRLVITNDPFLRTALNIRRHKAHIGFFAITPRELASRYAPFLFDRPLLEDAHAVLEISRSLSIPLKTAHYDTARLFRLWEQSGTGSAVEERIRETPYEPRRERILSVWNTLSSLPTICAARDRFRWKTVPCSPSECAAAGTDLFSPLDMQVLPSGVKQIPLFEDTPWKLPQFFSFPDENSIADMTASMITEEYAADTAVIASPESGLLAFLSSRLSNMGIPVCTTESLRDNLTVRNILSLIETALSRSGLRVKDAAPFAGMCGCSHEFRSGEWKLEEYVSLHGDKQLRAFMKLLHNIRDTSFSRILTVIQRACGTVPPSLYEELSRLGILESKITSERYRDAVYYLNHLCPGERKNGCGVMFANCRTTAYIDRPLCFFLSMDDTWTAPPETFRRESGSAEEERDITRFSILLQQGRQRFYFVPRTKNGEKAVPCSFFNLLFDKQISGFDDPLFRTKRIDTCPSLPLLEKKGKPEPESPDVPPLTHFSKTSLNSVLFCPRYFSYTRLLGTEEKDYMKRGSLLHEFAAFYRAAPDKVKSRPVEYWADIMAEEMLPFADEHRIPVERSLCAIGAENLITFIDSLECAAEQVIPLSGEQSRTNTFALHCGISPDFTNTEADFRDDTNSIKGKIDLAAGPAHIIDYKTGTSLPSKPSMIRSTLPRLAQRRPDVQTILYITVLHEHTGRNVSCTYYFCLAGFRDTVMDTDTDVGRHTRKVDLIPMTFNEFCAAHPEQAVSSRAGRNIITRTGTNIWSELFSALPIPRDLQFDRNRISRGSYADTVRTFFKEKGDADPAEKDIAAVLEAAAALRTGHGSNQFLFRDDIEEFKRFVQEKKDEINMLFTRSFPCRPLSRDNCRECEFASVCRRDYDAP
mgnify:FL=1